MKNAIAYLRVSTEDQQLGPEAQTASIARWCAAHDVTLVGTFSDLGVSGAAPLDKRIGLMAAIDALTPGAVLLVAKRDRLARDLVLAAMIERLVERAGATIASADGAGNGTGPEAEMMRGILAVFAQFERALIRSRTKAALAAKRARGEKCGGIVPYGFVCPDGVNLVPSEDEQVVLRRARALRGDGCSLRTIGRVLMEEGFPTRAGKAWQATTLRRLLAV